MAGRLSYFAEKRGQNNDPNFFNRIPLDEIRRNVKRIIRDIKMDNIQDQDYNYFYNTQVIQACIAEAEDNCMRATILANSLNFYINEALNKGFKTFPSIDINIERFMASNEHTVQNARSKNWYTIKQIFVGIANGYYGNDIKKALYPISMIDRNELNQL